MSQKRQPKSGAKKKRQKRRSAPKAEDAEAPIEASGAMAGLTRGFRRVAGVEGGEGDERSARDRWTSRSMTLLALLALGAAVYFTRFR
ncbi:MAG: hypothetical protein AAGH15_22665 [Myxococcota bacterium]